MEYVMVPVPEEHVDAVQLFVRWGGTASPPAERDLSGIPELVAMLDEESRVAFTAIARAVADGAPLTVSEVAGVAGCSAREVAGLLLEVNFRISQSGGPPSSMLVEALPGAPDDASIWEYRRVLMGEDLAAAVARLPAA